MSGGGSDHPPPPPPQIHIAGGVNHTYCGEVNHFTPRNLRGVNPGPHTRPSRVYDKLLFAYIRIPVLKRLTVICKKCKHIQPYIAMKLVT